MDRATLRGAALTRLLTSGSVARALGVHIRTVRRWCEAGELRAFQVRGRWYVTRDDLSAWLASKRGHKGTREPRPT